MATPKHKRKFILANSSSAPWINQVFDRSNLVDLGDNTSFDASKADMFRVGFNAASGFLTDDATGNNVFRTGFKLAEMTSPTQRPQDMPSTWQTHPDLRGQSFVVGRWDQNDNFVAYSREGTFSPLQSNAYPLGQAIPSRTNPNSITGSLRTKQDFLIAPAGGSAGMAGSPTWVPDWWKSEADWTSLVGNYFQNQTFYDLSFSMDFPMPLDQIKEDPVLASVHQMYVSLTPSYNFYVKPYEVGINEYDNRQNREAGFPVYMLPSIYMFASELDESFRDPTRSIEQASNFWKHITLDGRIPTTFVDVLDTTRTKKIGEKDIGQHFQKFGNLLSQNSFVQAPKEKYKNFIFPRSNLDILKDHQGKEKLFPMHMEIEFSTDVNTRFADFLRDAKLTSFLMKYIMSQPAEEWSQGAGWAQWVFPDWTETDETSGQTSLAPVPAWLQSRYRNPQVWDFGQFIDGILLESRATPNNPTTLSDEWRTLLEEFEKGTFLGEHSSEVRAALQPDYALFTQLMMHVFRSNSHQLVADSFRSFEDLLKNNISGEHAPMAYSETLLYCVHKMTGTRDKNVSGGMRWDSTGNESQKIWFPNSSEIDILKYIDTQIKFGKPYRYMISAYQLVVGNEYKYAVNNSQTRGTTGDRWGTGGEPFWAPVCLFNTPSLKLVEIPIYDSVWDHPWGISVTDSPPPPPDAHIIPYQSVDDKILIWLNGNVGDFEAEFIAIHPEDYEGVGDRSKPIRFKADEPATGFEIFKLDKRPRQYLDFAEGEPIRIGGEEDSPSAASYIDTNIKPNKKYYYTFRSVDAHGKLSNPTAVYECELVKNDEFVYPVVRLIDMTKDPDIQIKKPFRKFLQIKPAFHQTVLKNTNNLDRIAQRIRTSNLSTLENDFSDQIEFQDPGTSLWNTRQGTDTKWKIRLHSKKSGKMIDFNIDFTRDNTISGSTLG